MSSHGRFPVLKIGCLATALLMIFAVVVSVRASARQDRLRKEQRLQENFDSVKQGVGGVPVGVMDPELMEIFAQDEDCIKNLRVLELFMADLSDPRFLRINDLNPHTIFFYSCNEIDQFLPQITRLNVEQLDFETTPLSQKSLLALAKFPNLKRVRFEQVMSPAEQALVKEILPGVEIEFEVE